VDDFNPLGSVPVPPILQAVVENILRSNIYCLQSKTACSTIVNLTNTYIAIGVTIGAVSVIVVLIVVLIILYIIYRRRSRNNSKYVRMGPQETSLKDMLLPNDGMLIF
jgi:flagellar biosynthesis/type III secretory pathway M-ring protein FliF/YscJ